MDWCWYSCCAYGDWCHPDSSEFTDSEAIRKNVSETKRHILGETSQWDGNTDSAVIPYWLVWKGAELTKINFFLILVNNFRAIFIPKAFQKNLSNP